MSDSWHSYPSIYALGHRALANLFVGPVVIEEKVDGSQFSFGRFGDELRCRSKGQQLILDAPEKMFTKAVDTVKQLGPSLHDGWTYSGEFLAKPKHNTLAYERVPAGYLILFDIRTGEEAYLAVDEKQAEAARLDLEVVPVLASGVFDSAEPIKELLGKQSCLGGAIEGVVVKNYAQFGLDKKVLMGKYVQEYFKELNAKAFRQVNPTRSDVVQFLIERYKNPARWAKAVQHLRESGRLDGSPKDIGALLKEVQADIEKECVDEIREALYKWAKPQIMRASVAGLPEWYKGELLKSQFAPAGEASA